MILFNDIIFRKYKRKDVIKKNLDSTTFSIDKQFTAHKWLAESLQKRMIFFYIYGDILKKNIKKKKILDVGGGYSALTRLILKNHCYTLLDIMAHDDHGLLKKLQKDIRKEFWVNKDWYRFMPKEKYDIVIANDLFPNVDQRIEEFIEKFLPYTLEIRISLTYYNTPKFYKVKRIDEDEIFFIVPWNGEQTKNVISRYKSLIRNYNASLFSKNVKSIFPNNRIVSLIIIRAKLHDSIDL